MSPSGSTVLPVATNRPHADHSCIKGQHQPIIVSTAFHSCIYGCRMAVATATALMNINPDLSTRIAVLLEEMKEKPLEVVQLLAKFWYCGQMEILEVWRKDVL